MIFYCHRKHGLENNFKSLRTLAQSAIPIISSGLQEIITWQDIPWLALNTLFIWLEKASRKKQDSRIIISIRCIWISKILQTICCDVWNSRSDEQTNKLIYAKMSRQNAPHSSLKFLQFFRSCGVVEQSNHLTGEKHRMKAVINYSGNSSNCNPLYRNPKWTLNWSLNEILERLAITCSLHPSCHGDVDFLANRTAHDVSLIHIRRIAQFFHFLTMKTKKRSPFYDWFAHRQPSN